MSILWKKKKRHSDSIDDDPSTLNLLSSESRFTFNRSRGRGITLFIKGIGGIIDSFT